MNGCFSRSVGAIFESSKRL